MDIVSQMQLDSMRLGHFDLVVRVSTGVQVGATSLWVKDGILGSVSEPLSAIMHPIFQLLRIERPMKSTSRQASIDQKLEEAYLQHRVTLRARPLPCVTRRHP